MVPKVLTANKRKLTQIFDFVHNTMGVPHNLITKFPQVNDSFIVSLLKCYIEQVEVIEGLFSSVYIFLRSTYHNSF